MSDKRRGLGRGLGALIPTAPTPGRTDRPVDVFFPEPDDEGRASRGTAFASNGVGSPPHTGEVTTAQHRSEEQRERAEAAVSVEQPSGDPTPPPQEPARETAPGEDGGAVAEVSRETSGELPASHQAPDAIVESAADQGSGDVQAAEGLVPVPGARFAELPVGSISPNPRQPRTVFDEDEMAELVHSVAEIGVLQPVVVRPVETDEPGASRYELVMGERRWRASQQAGLATVPAIIRDTGDDDLLRDALLENLHRSQLNPLEEAAAYSQLLEDFGCTHDVLATRIGRSRPQISNTLRLLRLPPLVQRRVAAGVLSAGHARALLGLADAAAIERLAQRIVAEGLSVRAVEEIVALGGDDAPTRRPRAPRAGSRHASLDELAQRLSDRFDTRVQIALGRRKGRLSVEFASVEDLNRILELLAPGDTATLGREDEGPGGAVEEATGPGAAEFDAVGFGSGVEGDPVGAVDRDDTGYGPADQARAAG